ncbi:Poly [ADP-ribose] polymerase 6 [Tritrichomonas musculus]|uniref:Poly [ADP-ribose] polymerase 6 n=1 Tax=Tritrichomonas musculus TaxID=1915356 RepID=A0ABR2KWJ7_9EUKA
MSDNDNYNGPEDGGAGIENDYEGTENPEDQFDNCTFSFHTPGTETKSSYSYSSGPKKEEHITKNPDEIPRDSPLFSWLGQYMHGIEVNRNDNKFPVSLFIPRTVLPLSLQILYGFDVSSNALKITIDQGPEGEKAKYKIKAEQPVFGENFAGSNLVEKVINAFSNDNYKVKEYYRSAPFVLYNKKVQPNSANIQTMIERGYGELQSEKALSNCDNDVEKSIHLLRTGEYEFPKEDIKVSEVVKYEDNPLIYLILGIVDSILDLQDHCSICGDPIPRCIKPTSCEKLICYTQLASIGLGPSVIQEIRRDIKVADFLFTVFVSAIGSKFLIPAPPPLTTQLLNEKMSAQDEVHTTKKKKKKSMARDEFGQETEEELTYDPDYLMGVVKRIPSFEDMSKYANDEELRKSIGNEAFKLLSWVLFSNRTQLFWLPPPLELDVIKSADKNCIQFMSLMSSPEQESIFQQMKQKYGSIFFWHGSALDKWHSIIRNGLINTSRIKGMVLHAAAYGEGIYLASDSSTSKNFSRSNSNPWNKSSLTDNLSVIALCEVIKLPFGATHRIEVDVKNRNTGEMERKTLVGFLKSHGDGIFTLTIEEALIVRFLFVNFKGNLNVNNNPPTDLPTFGKFIDYRMKNNK